MSLETPDSDGTDEARTSQQKWLKDCEDALTAIDHLATMEAGGTRDLPLPRPPPASANNDAPRTMEARRARRARQPASLIDLDVVKEDAMAPVLPPKAEAVTPVLHTAPSSIEAGKSTMGGFDHRRAAGNTAGGEDPLDALEGAIENMHSIVLQHQEAAWQGVLGHVVQQLSRNGVVAAELWLRWRSSCGCASDEAIELRRAPGGFFVSPSFAGDRGKGERELLEKLMLPPPPNAPDMGLAGIHWSQGVDKGEGDMDTAQYSSRDNNSRGRASKEQAAAASAPQDESRRVRASKAQDSDRVRRRSAAVTGVTNALASRLRRPSNEQHDWDWTRLDQMVDNPEMLFDDHARHVARTFGLCHCLKFRSRTDDFGGVMMLYTAKETIESDQDALQYASAKSFSHTIPRLVTSHCVTSPFHLPLANVLGAFKYGVDEAAHVLLWVVSGGQYRIAAHYVSEARRKKLKESRGDHRTYILR